MIDFSMLKLGDKVYNIYPSLHAFRRQKITTVIDGVEWYRYDTPMRTYTIDEFTYVGRSESHIFGDVIPEDIDDTKYFVRNDQLGEMSFLHIHDHDVDWFASKYEAEQEVKRRVEDDKRIDRS